MNVTVPLLVNAIAGVGFPVPMNVAEHAEALGLAHCMGRTLIWDREVLAQQSLNSLTKLYTSLVSQIQ